MRRLGDLHRRRPRLVAAFIAVATVAALSGLPRLQFEDDPRAIFRVADDEFAALEHFHERFGPDDQDLYLIIDGGDLFSAKSVEALWQTDRALRALPSVESVVGLLDVRKRGPIPLMVIPAGDLSPERLERARRDALVSPIANGHFLSADGSTTLMAVRLEGSDLGVSELRPKVDVVRRAAEAHLGPAGLRLRLAGHPSIRIDLLATLRLEIVKFTVLSAIVSGAIALVIYRTPAAVLISIAGPAAGVAWTLGAMGWLGVKIDPMSVVLPTLLFVVGFTDAVHLVSEMQAARDGGASRGQAAAVAVAHVGPACLLTAITTIVAFGSLAAARTEAIQHFGLTCAAGTIMTFLAVQLVTPASAVSRWGEGLAARQGNRLRSSTRAIDPLYRRLLYYPVTVTALSALGAGLLFYKSLELPSDQRWTEALPENSETVAVTEDANRLFGGSMFAFVVVEWPEELRLVSPPVLRVLKEVHAAGEATQELRGPFSILTLLQSFRLPGERLADQTRHLRRMPPTLLAGLYQARHRQAVVSLHVPDVGAAALAPDFARLDDQLRRIETLNTGFKLRLTGAVVVAARNVNQMIRDLARSLTLASCLIFTIIALLFRSLTFGLLSIVPNVLPQAFTAGLLLALDEPLTMTSVMTFSLCLGLSIDDTVHYLMRYRTERRAGGSPRRAALATFRAVGGVMIVTSLVLIGGFLTMLLSAMPGVRMFALLSSATLAAAILGDLIILPALILTTAKWSRRR